MGSFGITGWHDEAKGAGPGVTVGRSGASIGVATWVDGPFWPLNTTLYATDFKGNDPRFVFYVLDSIDFAAYNSGSAQPSLNRNFIASVPVRIPPVPVQRKIAAVLAAYDELIEKNLRRIEILEEMAQVVYREWFVRFRFPGHEDIRLVDSPLGPIPDGWTVAPLGEVAEYVSRGISPKYDETTDAVVLNQKCIRDHRVSFGPSRTHASKVKDEKFVRRGDVLVNSTGVGTLGRVAQLRRDVENVTVDSHITIVRPPAHVAAEYWGRALIAEEAAFESFGAGATGQTELRKSAVEARHIVLAPATLTHSYAELVRPIDALAENLQNQIENLRSTRDLLLPKLVSGEIDVSELDIETEWLVS